jgi:hypothetical protein
MAKIGEIKVIPSKTPALANTPGLQADRFKQMQKLENQLEVKQAALKATPSDVEKGSDGEPLDQTRKAQVLATLAKQRKDLEIQMDHYLEQLNNQIASANGDKKIELQDTKNDITSFQNKDNKATDETIETIEAQATQRDEAQLAIKEKTDKLEAEMAELRAKTAGQVIDASSPKAQQYALKLQALNDQKYSLSQQSEALMQAGYTKHDLEALHKVLTTDIKADAEDVFGDVDDTVANMTDKFKPLNIDPDTLDTLKKDTKAINTSRVDTDGVTVSDTLNTGGFTAVQGATEEKHYGQGTKESQIALPSTYSPIQVSQTESGATLVIAKAGDCKYYQYIKEAEIAGGLGYVTRQQEVVNKDGKYVPKEGTVGKLYYKKDADAQTFSTVWDREIGDKSLVGYDPTKQAEFAAKALEATKDYTPPAPAETPTSSGVGGSATPATQGSTAMPDAPGKINGNNVEYVNQRRPELQAEGLDYFAAGLEANKEASAMRETYYQDRKATFEEAKAAIEAMEITEPENIGPFWLDKRRGYYREQGYNFVQAGQLAQAEQSAHIKALNAQKAQEKSERTQVIQEKAQDYSALLKD